MTGAEMVSAAIKLFGEHGYITALAEALRVDRATVFRWVKLKEIPGPVEAAIRCWTENGPP